MVDPEVKFKLKLNGHSFIAESSYARSRRSMGLERIGLRLLGFFDQPASVFIKLLLTATTFFAFGFHANIGAVGLQLSGFHVVIKTGFKNVDKSRFERR